MEDQDLGLSIEIISDCNDILTVAIRVGGVLTRLVAGHKDVIFSELKRMSRDKDWMKRELV